MFFVVVLLRRVLHLFQRDVDIATHAAIFGSGSGNGRSISLWHKGEFLLGPTKQKHRRIPSLLMDALEREHLPRPSSDTMCSRKRDTARHSSSIELEPIACNLAFRA